MPMVVTARPTELFDLRVLTLNEPDAVRLMAEADAYNTQLYGHADATPLQRTEFELSHGGLFLVGYRLGQAAGCGGYRHVPDREQGATAEIKRIYVRPDLRRTGLARAILTTLEERARQAGYGRLILDVGSKQPAAHALYESAGYHRIPGFSIYRDRPGNRAYGKDL